MFTPTAATERPSFGWSPELNLLTTTNLSRKQLRDIEAIINEHYQEIVDAWRRHFGN